MNYKSFGNALYKPVQKAGEFYIKLITGNGYPFEKARELLYFGTMAIIGEGIFPEELRGFPTMACFGGFAIVTISDFLSENEPKKYFSSVINKLKNRSK